MGFNLAGGGKKIEDEKFWENIKKKNCRCKTARTKYRPTVDNQDHETMGSVWNDVVDVKAK